MSKVKIRQESNRLHSFAELKKSKRYLEVVRRVAVCVLGHMQEDEQVLAEVVRHGRKPRETEGGEAERHHLAGGRTRRLDELNTVDEAE